MSGNIIAGRKGGVFMRVEISGRSAHSGVNFSQGISAIEELARKVRAIHKVTDLEKGTTVNVGLVSGGQSVNTVAPHACAEVDLRYVKPADRDEAMAAITHIVEESFVPGTTATLEIKREFLPLVPSEASQYLFDINAESARRVGLPVGAEFTGGCADSGFAAATGVPVICSVGPSGAMVHSPDELMELDPIVLRAQAVARSIVAIASSTA